MSSETGQPFADRLSAGHEALARGVWAEARTRFEAALGQDETSEAWEGLGMAAWWLNDAPTTFDARERAYHLYRQRDDRRGARGDRPRAGPLSFPRRACRGQRLVPARPPLAGGARPGPRARLACHLGGTGRVQVDHDTATARQLGAQAATLSRALGVIDLEMLVQALEGWARVSQGEVAEGMRLLDGATAAAVAGEMTDLDAMTTACCYLISACEQVRDYERAAQWCDRVTQIAERWAYRLMFALCRSHYAGVLIWRGAWPEAEAELTAATEELAATHPAMAAEGIVKLAELRRRQGRLEEATALLGRAEAPHCGC